MGPSGAGSIFPRNVSTIWTDNSTVRDFSPGFERAQAPGLAATTFTRRMWLERRTIDRDVVFVMARSPRGELDLPALGAHDVHPTTRTTATTAMSRGGGICRA